MNKVSLIKSGKLNCVLLVGQLTKKKKKEKEIVRTYTFYEKFKEKQEKHEQALELKHFLSNLIQVVGVLMRAHM